MKPTIGKNTKIYGVLDGVNPGLITIGNHCVIGRASAILTHCPVKGAKPVKIGDYVWIGYGAIILPGVTIQDTCIIGAGAVITKNVPTHSIAAGNPAKVLRRLTDEEAKKLRHDLYHGKIIGKRTKAEQS